MITKSELFKIASLAKLSPEELDAEAMITDMSELLALADTICGLDLSGLDCSDNDDIAQLREDIPVSSLPAEEILKNAPQTQDGFFSFAAPGGAGGVI